jgi:RNA polymerase sigma-70 factor (ECF subfamily)
MSLAATLPWNAFAVLTLPERRERPVGKSVKPQVVQKTSMGPSSDSTRIPAPRTQTTAVRAAAGIAAEVDWTLVVKRCVDGDSQAWTELVRGQHRRVYGLCYRFTGSSHDAEDLTQDVFLKLYGNLKNFDSAKGGFNTWITTLTRNLLVDHFRKSRLERASDSFDEGWEGGSEEGLHISDRMASKAPSPHDHAAKKELGRMVQAALARVSPELREAVILRDLQDMDYKEIAAVLRVPEGTVKSRISRGRAELARLLERSKGQVM